MNTRTRKKRKQWIESIGGVSGDGRRCSSRSLCISIAFHFVAVVDLPPIQMKRGKGGETGVNTNWGKKTLCTAKTKSNRSSLLNSKYSSRLQLSQTRLLMGLRKTKSQTLPSSPIHHRSFSSDFEFTVSHSPRQSTTTNLRPADELFYKGQLLPLHLSPRNSMVRTLLLTSNTITARHSSDYHSSFSYETTDSSRPSSATDDDDTHLFPPQPHRFISKKDKKVFDGKPFSFNRFSSVFQKETKEASCNTTQSSDPATLTSSSVKEKIRKYLKKVKPLYEKLSQLQSQKTKTTPSMAKRDDVIFPSFSGNLRFFRRTSCVSSCPSTMPSSPNHSGVLCRQPISRGAGGYTNSLSSTEELQSAIQGAIAHCKSSMTNHR
ncbi:hypothetical protein L1887_38891 [Cichorium endivia]|nr:hypothetical protein L1887_38891 [Cichorium endivia]